ncbi:MAG TPA: glycosyltransferase family 4 protein [Candidatus Hydrogenedentes bacterium]|nr:glycosyltransferase family 4 protein [Candidatus Hydrogenedentota bacterium]HPG66002.1 glycosyltransferase family 4 protein [Candidatus Hydrogenedentota bacterium]
MKKALLITPNFPPVVGGVAHILHHVCRSLPPEQIVVLAPWGVNTSADREYNADSKAVARAFDAEQPFRIYRAGYRMSPQAVTLLSVFWFGLHTLWLILRERPDVLYFGQPYPIGLIGLVTRLVGVPYVVHTYGSELVRPRGPLGDRLRRLVLRNAFRVITISQWGSDTVVHMGVAPQRAVVIHPKLDLERFEQPFDVDAFKAKEGLAGKRVLITVGRLSVRKGQHLVIRALPEILKDFPNTVYAVVGAGPEEAMMRDEAHKAGVADRVLFPGNRDVVAFYKACDLFIMPSLYIERPRGDIESFGIVYIEANACGKPAIGADNGGIPDAVLDGETGLLVETDSVSSIVEAVTRLLADAALCERLGRQGYARVKREFTLDKYAEEFQRLVLDPLPPALPEEMRRG